ncbi:PAS domain-containing protein [Qipengyuania mesophila]|uniref:PAS domain-containing protein n=1 Tax=Qipengyuania mesophila TaxID=2867246 RepID=UPI00351634C7
MDAVIDRLGGFFGSREAEDDFDDAGVEDYDADVEAPPSPVGQDERRMQVRAYNHWASLLGDRNFPHIDDLHPDTLEDFGPYSVLLDLTQDIEDPRLRYVGGELLVECRTDKALSQLSAVPSRSVLSRLTDHYMQILANQAPIGFEAEFDNAEGASVLYRGILLPYSSDDATVDYIYGVINWKEMADRQTADALLLELDQALGTSEEELEPAYADRLDSTEMLGAFADEDVLELSGAEMMELAGADSGLPRPVFGATEGSERGFPTPRNSIPLAARLDALGNPIGGYEVHDEADEDDDFDGRMKTAADYGLPDWDEDEDESDVDDVVDPLADEEASSSLVALVNRGDRTKKSVDLSLGESMPAPDAGENDSAAYRIPEAYVPPPAPMVEAPVAETADANTDDLSPVTDEFVQIEDTVPDWSDDSGAPENLYDALAAARELAQAAQNTEDRSRKTLYEAVGRAYDFSIEAQSDPAGFDELLSESGLTMQDRAPMTPVVKLVFGADYDKTRLTEYAAVLTHGHRLGIERGKLASFLREAEGGLKGVVQAERAARKEEQGKPTEDRKTVRTKLAEKLRVLEALSLAELDEEGAEFALVMVRRTANGTIEILGEVPEDIPLVERAARKLLD